jgi:hypothetical protein
MAASTCDKALVVSMASLQRNVMLAVFGMNPTDRTHLAEISIEMSLRDIVQAEDSTRQQLQLLIKVVRERDVKRQRAQLTADLMKSKKLRNDLCVLEGKRNGMQMQMDKLRESKLNMQMLQSMKHTNMALQNLGFKISDADDIMLDLEEANSDAAAMQQTLSSSYADEDDFSPGELETELALMLSEDALVATRAPARARSKAPEPAAAPEGPAPAAAPEGAQPAQGRPPDEPPCAPTESAAESARAPAAAAGAPEGPKPAAALDMVAPVVTMYPAEAPRKKKVRAAEARAEARAAEAAAEPAAEAAAEPAAEAEAQPAR